MVSYSLSQAKTCGGGRCLPSMAEAAARVAAGCDILEENISGREAKCAERGFSNYLRRKDKGQGNQIWVYMSSTSLE